MAKIKLSDVYGIWDMDGNLACGFCYFKGVDPDPEFPLAGLHQGGLYTGADMDAAYENDEYFYCDVCGTQIDTSLPAAFSMVNEGYKLGYVRDHPAKSKANKVVKMELNVIENPGKSKKTKAA
jgi:hypothetical protein